MDKFWVVFKYEFFRQVKNKVFIVITSLFLLLSIGGGLFISYEVNKQMNNPGSITEVQTMPLYVYSPEEYKDYILQINDFQMYDVEFIESVEALHKIVEENNSMGLIVSDYDNVQKVLSGLSVMNELGMIDGQLNDIYRSHLFEEVGISQAELETINNSKLTIDTIRSNDNSLVGFGYTYVFSFLLYMTVTIFGAIVSTSVVTEKTSKAMELLITSADAKSLISGKVFAIGLTCLMQIILILTGFLLPVFISIQGTPLMDLIREMDIIRPALLVYGLFLFIVGFFSILFMFAGLSSFATKPEDANIVATPLVLVTLVVFMINLSVVGTNYINIPIMKVISYIPIISPFLLYSRYAIYGLSNFEIVFGVITNIMGAALLIWMAAKIYRAGTLHYGNTISFKRMFKSLK